MLFLVTFCVYESNKIFARIRLRSLYEKDTFDGKLRNLHDSRLLSGQQNDGRQKIKRLITSCLFSYKCINLYP